MTISQNYGFMSRKMKKAGDNVLGIYAMLFNHK
jgi:hypothetical protein